MDTGVGVITGRGNKGLDCEGRREEEMRTKK